MISLTQKRIKSLEPTKRVAKKTQSDGMVAGETTTSLTIRSDATKEVLRELTDRLAMIELDNEDIHQIIDGTYFDCFGDVPVIIDPLPSDITPTDSPKLKLLEEAITKVREKIGNMKRIQQKTIDSIGQELKRAILLDYWDLCRWYDISEVEQEAKEQIQSLSQHIEPKSQHIVPKLDTLILRITNLMRDHSPLLLLTWCKYIQKVTERQIQPGDTVLSENIFTNPSNQIGDFIMSTDLNIETTGTETLELHPYCALFPEVDKDTFAALVADIKQNGLRDPIILLDGKILDGRNRYNACLAAGIEPHFVEYDETKCGDPLLFVLSKNLHRRQLTKSQGAMIAARLSDLPAHRPAKSDKCSKVSSYSLNQSDAATEFGVSRTYVQDAKKLIIAHKEGRIGGEIIEQIDRGEISLSTAMEILKSLETAEKVTTPSTDQSVVQDEVVADISTPEPIVEQQEIQDNLNAIIPLPEASYTEQPEIQDNPNVIIPTPEEPIVEQSRLPNQPLDVPDDEYGIKRVSGVYRDRDLKKNFTELRTTFGAMCRIPDLINDSLEILASLEHEQEVIELRDTAIQECETIISLLRPKPLAENTNTSISKECPNNPLSIEESSEQILKILVAIESHIQRARIMMNIAGIIPDWLDAAHKGGMEEKQSLLDAVNQMIHTGITITDKAKILKNNLTTPDPYDEMGDVFEAPLTDEEEG